MVEGAPGFRGDPLATAASHDRIDDETVLFKEEGRGIDSPDFIKPERTLSTP